MNDKKMVHHQSMNRCFCPVFITVFCILAFMIMSQPPGMVGAYADTPPPGERIDSGDQDGDLLPDLFERLLGTDAAKADSDGDGVPDGFEYALHADPLSAVASPTIEPGLRMGLYEDGDVLKVSFYLLPGDPSELHDFKLLMAYSDYFHNDDGTMKAKRKDLTNMIPYAAYSSDSIIFSGVEMTRVEIGLPKKYLEMYSPLSLGVSTHYNFDLQSTFFDIVDIKFIDGKAFQLKSMGEGAKVKYLSPLADADFLEGLDDIHTNEICKTTLEEQSSTEGVVEYVVKTAECQAMPDQTCSDSGCAAQIGGIVRTIDPNFMCPSIKYLD